MQTVWHKNSNQHKILFMSYSLLDRFRGAWLGSIVPLRPQQEVTQQVAQWEQNTSFDVQQSYQWLASTEQNQTIDKETNPARLLLKLLPAIVYYHDDWKTLAGILQDLSQNAALPANLERGLLVWSYIICLELRGKDFLGLTNLLTMKLELQPTEVEWLNIVEISYLQGSLLTELEQRLIHQPNREISLSIFCFLCNPEDYSLAVAQALRATENATLVAALTGALSGAYNGWHGIPVFWRYQVRDCNFFSQILRYTEDTIQKWCGLEVKSDRLLSEPFVVTAPRVAQARESLKIVSQADY